MKIQLTSVMVDDQDKALAFYTNVLGVEFSAEPTPQGPVITAVFNDTCGNLIQIYQLTAA